MFCERNSPSQLRKRFRLGRAGFTLIELLVVIGIIGILAGLLLPVLARAREQGRSVKCLNNEKQMGVGIILYADDYHYYPPGRQDGVTQWDLCAGTYAGGKNDMTTPEARTALFMCPSVTRPNRDVHLNFSGNPNVLREVTEKTGPAKPEDVKRPTETILIADAIQYAEDGSSHAILWGVENNAGSSVYWNDGTLQKADAPIRVGEDKDTVVAAMDATGSNFRYRHNQNVANALFADGHVSHVRKGQVKERNLYTNY